jgi:non-heme chloroperoxidase
MKNHLFPLLAAALLSACGPENESPESHLSTLAEALDAEAAPREGFVQLSTGVRMHYVEQGRLDGPVLLLLHGYTDSSRSFDLDYPLLSRRYHVYALDQRGHGDSSRPTGGYSQSHFAADVVAFLNARGHARATLLGHSMGSFIAQQVALEYPARVRALVLVGSAPTARGNAVIADLKSVVDTLEDPIDPAFVRDFQASTFYRPIPPAFLDTAVAESLEVPARVWKAALAGLAAEDHGGRLASIRVPALVVGGDQDSIFSVAEQRALAQKLRRGRLLLYPDTGHAPHVEQPQRFVTDVTAFLDELPL